jgi:hypothetical protein
LKPQFARHSLTYILRSQIRNSKSEIRNKSKTQSKNVQNEEAQSCKWHSRWLVGVFLRAVNGGACPDDPQWSVAPVLVISIFGFEFVSDFVLRIWDLESVLRI